jgi:hypothetical protein
MHVRLSLSMFVWEGPGHRCQPPYTPKIPSGLYALCLIMSFSTLIEMTIYLFYLCILLTDGNYAASAFDFRTSFTASDVTEVFKDPVPFISSGATYYRVVPAN